jgi:prepilin-type N-terminal cleavage/methylation domain-containing protein
MHVPQKKNQQKAFTLIEIVVSATILVILTSIGFYSYTKNISDARDSARLSDLSALQSQLSLYKRERWAYPFPGNYFNILNRWGIVALQWKMNKSVSLSTATNLPVDPDLDIPYFYGTTKNRQEYQLAVSIENSEDPLTYLVWDYKSISTQVLPNILLAIESTSDVEINNVETVTNGDTNRNLFLFHNWFHTLPYDFISAKPYSDGSDFDLLLSDGLVDYWQNTDYRSCEEISTAAKRITPDGDDDEYQILSNTWVLTPVDCLCTSTGCTQI